MSRVEVYGASHSPWVQAVLLGLHYKEIECEQTPVPPLSILFSSGIMMPAARIGDAPWGLDSAQILQSLGYESISKDDLTRVARTWQGVLHRADNPWKFFRGFSWLSTPHPSIMVRALRHILRPFVTFYFFTIIKLAVMSRKSQSPTSFTDQFLHWEKKLQHSESHYFGGENPSIIDLQLFGIIQCHCSIPYKPLIETLQSDASLPKYRAWIARMQVTFSDYPHLFSSGYFQPYSAQPVQAKLWEKSAFWAGTGAMIAFFPVTLMLTMILLLRR